MPNIWEILESTLSIRTTEREIIPMWDNNLTGVINALQFCSL